MTISLAFLAPDLVKAPLMEDSRTEWGLRDCAIYPLSGHVKDRSSGFREITANPAGALSARPGTAIPAQETPGQIAVPPEIGD